MVVQIDNADISNPLVTFTYRNNPNITSVSPQRTIPSGGIELTFSGEDLDVVQTPVLVLTLPDGSTVVSGYVWVVGIARSFNTLCCLSSVASSDDGVYMNTL